MKPAALQNCPNADTDSLSFQSFLLALREGRFQWGKDEQVIFLSSIAFGPDVLRFWRAIFHGIYEIYMIDDWITKHALLTTKHAELKKSTKLSKSLLR